MGKREFPGNFGLFRADVAANFGDRPTTFKNGFNVAVEVPRIPNQLRFEARNADGSWKEIFSRRVRSPLINLGAIRAEGLWPIGDYAAWIKRYDTLHMADRRKIRAHINRFVKRPRISILMPVYNPSADHLRRAIESVRDQLYPEWELCIVDDASMNCTCDRFFPDTRNKTRVSRFSPAMKMAASPQLRTTRCVLRQGISLRCWT